MSYSEGAKRRQRRRVLDGRNAEAWERYKPHRNSWRNDPIRKRAHNLARKYGLTIPQMRKLGWFPDDVQEALNGNR